MTYEDIREALVTHLVDLDETYVLTLVERLLQEGVDPLAVIKDCEKAMFGVGELYATRQYYLSGLLMAGEIFREVMALTQPHMEQQLTGKAFGLVLLDTVQGDIHDIGKSIVAVALRCYGFAVEDLGVDVPPERFLQYAEANPPDVVGLSGLITLAYESMRETIHLLRDHTPPGKTPIPVIIGGTTLNDRVCQLVGADYWTTDAMEGVRICQMITEKKHQ
ncbi:MAG: cobalamin-dependent protein [Syntrophorhabdales bacterium]|jgi:methanogenic corrinoid protein MtbC1